MENSTDIVGQFGWLNSGTELPETDPLYQIYERRHPVYVARYGEDASEIMVFKVSEPPYSPRPHVTVESKSDDRYRQVTSFGGKGLAKPELTQDTRLKHMAIRAVKKATDSAMVLQLANPRNKLSEASCLCIANVHKVPAAHFEPFKPGAGNEVRLDVDSCQEVLRRVNLPFASSSRK